VTVEQPAGTIAQRLRASGLAGLSWIACRLPEGPLVGLADTAGRLAYRLSSQRAAQARLNLRRIVDHLVASGAAERRIVAAAADPCKLEALVRAAFRHHARYYLEVMRAPALDERVFSRIEVQTPELVEAVLAADQSALFVTPHLGPIELPAVFVANRSGRRVTAPMETLGDPELQRWFERTRGVFLPNVGKDVVAIGFITSRDQITAPALPHALLDLLQRPKRRYIVNVITAIYR